MNINFFLHELIFQWSRGDRSDRRGFFSLPLLSQRIISATAHHQQACDLLLKKKKACGPANLNSSYVPHPVTEKKSPKR
jgi:hypothetical protein